MVRPLCPGPVAGITTDPDVGVVVPDNPLAIRRISGYTVVMVKVLVSLDTELVARLDREAAARGLSRSALLAELAAKGLALPVGPGLRPDVQRALREADALFAGQGGEDSTAAIRAERDTR